MQRGVLQVAKQRVLWTLHAEDQSQGNISSAQMPPRREFCPVCFEACWSPGEFFEWHSVGDEAEAIPEMDAVQAVPGSLMAHQS